MTGLIIVVGTLLIAVLATYFLTKSGKIKDVDGNGIPDILEEKVEEVKEVVAETKEKVKRVKEEVSDVVTAAKEVVKQAGDVATAAKGKSPNRKGRKPSESKK